MKDIFEKIEEYKNMMQELQNTNKEIGKQLSEIDKMKLDYEHIIELYNLPANIMMKLFKEYKSVLIQRRILKNHTLIIGTALSENNINHIEKAMKSMQSIRTYEIRTKEMNKKFKELNKYVGKNTQVKYLKDNSDKKE